MKTPTISKDAFIQSMSKKTPCLERPIQKTNYEVQRDLNSILGLSQY